VSVPRKRRFPLRPFRKPNFTDRIKLTFNFDQKASAKAINEAVTEYRRSLDAVGTAARNAVDNWPCPHCNPPEATP
jgi:hypothetical protein